MEEEVNWSGPLNASPCVLTTPAFLVANSVIVLHHKIECVILLGLHCTWLPFASGIKSQLISVAPESVHDLVPANLSLLFSPISGSLHVLFPLFGIP